MEEVAISNIATHFVSREVVACVKLMTTKVEPWDLNNLEVGSSQGTVTGLGSTGWEQPALAVLSSGSARVWKEPAMQR